MLQLEPGRRSTRSLRTSILLVGVFALSSLACESPVSHASADVASPPPIGATEGSVALRFGWPQGFAARVTGFESRHLVSGGMEDESRTDLSYRVRLEPSPEGSRIRYDDFALRHPKTSELVSLRSVPGLEALSLALRPSFVVSPDGRFSGTPGLDDDVALINRELDALQARPEPLPEGAPLLPTRFSAELFRRHAPVEWWPLVEMWTGREVEPGARYELDLVTRMPLLAGAPIRMDGELHVSKRCACDGGDGPRRCIELVLVTKADPLELLPLLGAEAERQEGEGPAPVTVTKLELDETVRLVTEPETLVPHRVESRTRARLALRLPDGTVHTDSLDQGLDLVFHPDSW